LFKYFIGENGENSKMIKWNIMYSKTAVLDFLEIKSQWGVLGAFGYSREICGIL
jgi:hypothetical protein